MSDDVGTTDGAGWPPAAPSTIRLRPRPAVPPRDGAVPPAAVPQVVLAPATPQEPAALDDPHAPAPAATPLLAPATPQEPAALDDPHAPAPAATPLLAPATPQEPAALDDPHAPAPAATPLAASPAVTAARPAPASAPPAAHVIAPAIPARSQGSIADPAWYRLRLVRDAAAALALVVAVGLAAAVVAGERPEGAVLSATSAPADPRGAPATHLSESVPSAAGNPSSPPGAAGSPSPTPAASGRPVASAPAATYDAAP